MAEDDIHIIPTDNTPEFHLNSNGIIKIKERGLYGNNDEVTKSIMKWIGEYQSKPAEITHVIIAFEYLNSSSTKILFSILKMLSQVILYSGKLVIQWYYEEDDEDILERGQFISSSLNIPINFVIINDISSI
jgi:hypothetical protein